MNSLSRLGFAEIELRFNNLIFQTGETTSPERNILIDISDYQSRISVINNQELEAFYPLFIGTKSFESISVPPNFLGSDWINEKLNAHDLSRATIILVGEEATYLKLQQSLNLSMESEPAFMKCCLIGLQD